jgi:hypothetical protein
MRIFVAIVLALVVICGGDAHAVEGHKIRMSLDDIFIIAVPTSWNFKIEKELTLRFANINITPKRGEDFNMMLYFKCDTPDLSQFDTPEKIRKSVESSSQQYLPGIIGKKIVLQRVPIKRTYGFFTVLTDEDVAKKAVPAAGEFKYMTRGMVRLSKDSVLGFSIMSNSTGSKTYKSLLDYVYSFVNPEAGKR